MPRFSITHRLTPQRSGARWHANIDGQQAADLRFAGTPGPLLQVVGMCGGAGTSTLAYLIASIAAAQSQAPVLVCDTGGPTAGIALYAGVSSPRTLPDAAEQIAGEERLPDGGMFAVGQHGLRVIAGHPQFRVQGDQEGVRRVLRDARAVHALTVVDGGTLGRPADQAALSVATHVVWVLPATGSGVLRAQSVLERIAPLSRPEMIVARAEQGQGRAPVADLAALADSRRAPLVMVPQMGALPGTPPARMAERAALAMQAIGWLLRR